MATIVHISDVVGTRRVKMCDGTPQIPPAPEDTQVKELCGNCRVEFRKRHG